MSALPPTEQKAQAVEEMFDRIAPRYDLVNHVMTGGLDIAWRRRAVRMLQLPRGSRVVDLACGTGALSRELARAGYRTVGVDFSAGMLARARGVDELVRADVLDLPMDSGSADGVTSGFALRNVRDIGRCAAESARVLRKGGRMVMLDVAEPPPRLRWVQTVYFNRVVPIIGGVLSDRQAYRYLPQSTAYLPAPRVLLDIFRDAGFRDVRRETGGFGMVQFLIGARA